MSELCIRARVSGRVQGVWFRRFTQQQALAAGITGWVRNLADGRVEAMLCGEADAVEQVLSALRLGPESSRVDKLEQESVTLEQLHGFIIRHDAD